MAETTNSPSVMALIRGERLRNDVRALEKRLMKQVGQALAEARGGDAAKHIAALTKTLMRKTDAAIRGYRRAAVLASRRKTAERIAHDKAEARERARCKVTEDGLYIDGDECMIPWRIFDYADRPEESPLPGAKIAPLSFAFDDPSTGLGTAFKERNGLRVKFQNFNVLLSWP